MRESRTGCRAGAAHDRQRRVSCSPVRSPMSRSPRSRIYDFLFSSLTDDEAATHRPHRRGVGRRDDVRRAPRPGERVRRRTRGSRRRHRDRGGSPLPERAGVRDGVPRHPARGRRRHDDQLAVHRGRDPEAADGCRGHLARHGLAAAPPGDRRGRGCRHPARSCHRARRRRRATRTCASCSWSSGRRPR